MALYNLPTLTVTGSPQAMGQAYGEHFRAGIATFTHERLRAARANLWAGGVRNWDRYLRTSATCLEQLAAWQPAAHREHLAIAAGAGVDAVELYAAVNLTDLRDILLYGPGEDPGREGCTAFQVPPALTADGALWCGQTWDLNPPDLEFVCALHRLPDHGPETWSITVMGCAIMIGMNEHGLFFGTTNLKTSDSRPGLPYTSVLWAAAQAPSCLAASALVRSAPRCAAHSYWLADAHTGVALECSATRVHERQLAQTALVQTNHCLGAEIVAIDAGGISDSSRCRLDRARSLLAHPGQNYDSLYALMADRSQGVDSINRLHSDKTDTATNACLIARPESRALWACRGPAHLGTWESLPFVR